MHIVWAQMYRYRNTACLGQRFYLVRGVLPEIFRLWQDSLAPLLREINIPIRLLVRKWRSLLGLCVCFLSIYSSRHRPIYSLHKLIAMGRGCVRRMLSRLASHEERHEGGSFSC